MKYYKTPAQAVIFDLDGTLYHLPWMKFWMSVSLWSSVGYLRRLFCALDEVRPHQYADDRELLAALYDRLAVHTGSTVAKTKWWYEEQFFPAFVRLLGQRGRVRPGLQSLLNRLKSRGVRLGVLSDFGLVDERLCALGIEPSLFDMRVASETYGVLKPNSIPLVDMAEKWGISPANVVMVGDRADRDRALALDAGSRFLGISEKHNCDQADFFIWTDAVTNLLAQTNVE